MEKDELMIRKRRVRVKLVCSVLLFVLGLGTMFVGGAGIAYEGAKNILGLGVVYPLLIFAGGSLLGVRSMIHFPYKLFPFEKDKEGDLLRQELRNRTLGR